MFAHTDTHTYNLNYVIRNEKDDHSTLYQVHLVSTGLDPLLPSEASYCNSWWCRLN